MGSHGRFKRSKEKGRAERERDAAPCEGNGKDKKSLSGVFGSQKEIKTPFLFVLVDFVSLLGFFVLVINVN